jgi:hypothetical protein
MAMPQAGQKRTARSWRCARSSKAHRLPGGVKRPARHQTTEKLGGLGRARRVRCARVSPIRRAGIKRGDSHAIQSLA